MASGKISLAGGTNCCPEFFISFAQPESLYCELYVCVYIYIYIYIYIYVNCHKLYLPRWDARQKNRGWVMLIIIALISIIVIIIDFDWVQNARFMQITTAWYLVVTRYSRFRNIHFFPNSFALFCYVHFTFCKYLRKFLYLSSVISMFASVSFTFNYVLHHSCFYNFHISHQTNNIHLTFWFAEY